MPVPGEAIRGLIRPNSVGYSATIDHTNPLTTGLVFAMSGVAEHVSGTPTILDTLILPNTVARDPRAGTGVFQGVKQTSAGGGGARLYMNDQIRQALRTIKNDMTMMMVGMRIDSPGYYSGAFVIPYYSNNANASPWAALGIDTNAGAYQFRNGMAISGGYTSGYSLANLVPSNDGLTHTYVETRSGNAGRAFMDGVFQNTITWGASGDTDWGQIGDPAMLGGGYTTSAVTGDLAMVCLWNRVLSDAEIQQVMLRPDRLLVRKFVLALPDGGGAGTVDLGVNAGSPVDASYSVLMFLLVGLSVNATANATHSATLSSLTGLSVTATAAATHSATLSTVVPLSVNTSAAATQSATLSTLAGLNVNTSAAATQSATLSSLVGLSVSATASATQSATLSAQVGLSVTATASATHTANLTTGMQVNVSAAATHTVNLTTLTSLSVSATASATQSATLSTLVGLSVSASASASHTANLTTGMQVNVSAAATHSVTLSARVGLSVTSTAAATHSANLTTGAQLQVNVSAAATHSVTLSTPAVDLSVNTSSAATHSVTMRINAGLQVNATSAATHVVSLLGGVVTLQVNVTGGALPVLPSLQLYRILVPADLAQLRSLLRARLNEVNAVAWSDADLNAWLNEGAREVVRRTLCIEDEFSFPAVAGQQSYTPIEFHDAIQVNRVQYNRTGSSEVYPVEYADFNNLDQVWWTAQTQTQATPEYFTMWGMYPNLKFVCYPTPPYNGTFHVYYWRLCQLMIADDDYLELPMGWHDLAVDYAFYLALMRDRDQRWQEPLARFEQRLQRLQELTTRHTPHGGGIDSYAGTGQSMAWLYGG